MARIGLITLGLSLMVSPAFGMLYPELRICNYTRTSIGYQILGLETKPIECSRWNRLEADSPFQCQTVKLFEGPCQSSGFDSVRAVFDSDRYGRCVIPMIKVTSPGRIDLVVERQEPDSDNPGRLPLYCRWAYH
ncbi:MAG: hypothetical protein HYR96_12425 [Deltaproteobacteria bacterium]|nr:hypothetical protein [Deltaproteobacteria bacterium]MBI3296139.1 hypothetical protein [Deltaproteobacteria bacterium]